MSSAPMTEAAGHQFEFVPAPTGLEEYLNSLYILRVGAAGLEEALPAYSGQLLIALRGSGRMDFGSGFEEAPDKAFMIGPLTSARQFRIDGPALVIGASLNFLGWAALTRLPVVSYGDQFVPLAQAMGEQAAERLEALASRRHDEAEGLALALRDLAKTLLARLQPLSPGHRLLIDATYAWLSSSLNPDVEDLYARLPLSHRQTQRLVKRFFGLTPSRLKRRYRAIRAATLLADPEPSQADRDWLADAFYDQAHMIREIREFTGRTPRILSDDRDGLAADTLGKGGYGVPGLFAHEEEAQLAGSPDRTPD